MLLITVIISVWGHSENICSLVGVCPGTLKIGVFGTGTKPKMGISRAGTIRKGERSYEGVHPLFRSPQYSDTYTPNIPTTQYSDTFTICVLVAMLAFGLGFGYVKISFRVQFRVKISVMA